MNIVGIYKENGKPFQSQSFEMEGQKGAIQTAILNDAQSCNKVIEILIMTDNELKELVGL